MASRSSTNPGVPSGAAGRRPGVTDSAGRERLLDVSLELFSQRGIASTTVAQIAARSHVTSAMVHYWFKTREKLLDALVEERLAPRMREIWEQADFERDSPLRLVHGLVQRLVVISNRYPWLPSLWLREVIQEGGLLRERVVKRIPPRESAAFRRVISDGQSTGEINPYIAPDLIFISLLALVFVPRATGRILHHLNPEGAVDEDQYDQHVLALITHGVAAKTAVGRTAFTGPDPSDT